METMRTQTFTAKLSKRCHKALNAFLEQQCYLWNEFLEERIDIYEKHGELVTAYAQSKSLTTKRREDDEFSVYDALCQRTSLFRLDKAFQNFFRRVKNGEKPGFPRFKSFGRIRSFDVHRFNIYTKNGVNSFSIKGIGRFRFKGNIEGTPKLIRVVKTPRRVKIRVVCVAEKEVEKEDDVRLPLGIDVGIKERVTLSSGFQVPKRILDRSEIKQRQRKFSKTKKKSNNRRKKGLLLAKAWQRSKEKELGLLHELTSELVKNHGSKFYVEDLKIGNMVKNRTLARSILEQQWGTFIRLLAYKAEDAGGWVKKVDPKFTSQMCSECGGMPPVKLTLADRVYHCEHCGHIEDRDVNAAKNILRKGELAFPPAGNSPGRGKEEESRKRRGNAQDAGHREEQCSIAA